MNSIRSWIWDTTTSIVADTIALVSPLKAAEYRASRDAYKRSYLAASTKGPHQLWRPSNRSGNAEVAAASQMVRAKCRDMSRNNPLVAGMKLKRTTMVIGDEIGVKAQILDAKGKPAKDVNQILEDRFYQWAESASVDGRSLTELFQLGENHLFDDGEYLLQETLRYQDGMNPFRLMALEADYLDSSKDTFGIRYDADGRPTHFNLFSGHPGDGKTVESRPVPASGSDGLMIHLIAETDRASQRRGISQLASAVMRLYGLDDLEDAELVASRAACAYGIVVKSLMPGSITAPWTGGDTSTTDSPEDDNGKRRGYLEAGGILELDPGEDAIPFKNERPNSNFDSFIRGRQRTAAGAVGMSYESATGDYSQVNYSSARMGRIVEWGNIRRRQRRVMRILTRIWRVWLRFELIRAPIAGVKLDDPRAISPVWQLAGNDGIDPNKEVAAAEAGIMLGVTSRSRYVAEHGGDFGEIARELAEEKAILKELGIYQEDPTILTTGFVAPEPAKPTKEKTPDDDEEKPPATKPATDE